MAKKFNQKTWLVHQLRRLTLRYPPRNAAANRTKKTFFILSKKGKPMKRVSFTCEQCGKTDLKSSEKELDHTIPVVDDKGFTDWNEFINGLFCEETNFKILCLSCHTSKTAIENEARTKKKENV